MIKLWSITHFLHILVQAMALSLSVRVEEGTVKISALQMVNTQSLAPHSSPVMNLCHNFDVIHVTILTLSVHIKLFTNLICVLTLCKVQMFSGCLSFRSRMELLSIWRYTNGALVPLVCFREPLCVEADHRPTPPQCPAHV